MGVQEIFLTRKNYTLRMNTLLLVNTEQLEYGIQRCQAVRQDKGVLYSGWEAHMAKLNKQPLVSLGPFEVTQWVKCRRMN